MTPREIQENLKARELLDLTRQVAARHHVTFLELLGKSRRQPCVRAREELWARLYELIPSLTSIGRLFGRDHTTILGAIRRHRARHPYPQNAPCQICDSQTVLPAEGSRSCEASGPPRLASTSVLGAEVALVQTTQTAPAAPSVSKVAS